jgi:acetylornithine deacetylase/succinyl-diaminopimelate desuccinylase-like protein
MCRVNHPRWHGIAAAALFAAAIGLAHAAKPVGADPPTRQLAHDIFKELIEINTTDSVGSTGVAAAAMAKRLRDGGFAADDIRLLGPSDRKGNLVVRYRGNAGTSLRPVLIIGHLDVVEARREDWSTDPFQFVEQDGYYYGRGTQDMKISDAIAVVDFIRLRKEGYVPDRDIILALTADEEGGDSNGVDWLLKNHRELIDAEYVLNPDGGEVYTDAGKPISIEIQAAEKLYADFQVMATDRGGHSGLPTPDNPIYRVSRALRALENAPFPFELNAVTRAYYAQMAHTESAPRAADIRAMLATPADPAAIARLSLDPSFNARTHTTCVPTMQSGGHATNALPQRAEVNVNCRILPGHSQEEIRLALVRLFDDSQLTIRYRGDAGVLSDHGSDRAAMTPPPPRADLMQAVKEIGARLWPGTPVIPELEIGASDSIYTMQANMPSYGVCGVAIDRNDIRWHGRDERVLVSSFYDGLEFYYELLRALTGGKH